jgi:hypothetical protein
VPRASIRIGYCTAGQRPASISLSGAVNGHAASICASGYTLGSTCTVRSLPLQVTFTLGAYKFHWLGAGLARQGPHTTDAREWISLQPRHMTTSIVAGVVHEQATVLPPEGTQDLTTGEVHIDLAVPSTSVPA